MQPAFFDLHNSMVAIDDYAKKVISLCSIKITHVVCNGILFKRLNNWGMYVLVALVFIPAL